MWTCAYGLVKLQNNNNDNKKVGEILIVVVIKTRQAFHAVGASGETADRLQPAPLPHSTAAPARGGRQQAQLRRRRRRCC